MAFPCREAAYKGFSLLLFFNYCLISGASVQATTLQKFSLEQLAREADLIVRGHVQEIRSQEVPDRQSIATVVNLSVAEQWKGPRASTITVKEPGGSVGEITQRVMGAPQFSIGEEVILFLKKQADGHYATVAGKQGKFIIKIDSQTAKKTVEDLTGERQDESDFLRHLKEIVGSK